MIDPTNQSIDWTGFFIWAELKGVNYEESADIMLLIRQKLSEMREQKEERLKKLKSANAVTTDLLRRKFGG